MRNAVFDKITDKGTIIYGSSDETGRFIWEIKLWRYGKVQLLYNKQLRGSGTSPGAGPFHISWDPGMAPHLMRRLRKMDKDGQELIRSLCEDCE